MTKKPKAPKPIPDSSNTKMGRVIRHRRILLGLSQDALAKRVGITFQQIQKYENGRNNVVFPMLVKIAAALDVPPMILVADATVTDVPQGEVSISERALLEFMKRVTVLNGTERRAVFMLVQNLADGRL